MHSCSVYQDSPSSHLGYLSPVPQQIEVAVIGGGISGLSTLHHLTRNGVGAHLFEADTIGSAQSGRSAGFVLPGFELDASNLVRRFGVGRARDLYAETLRSISDLRFIVVSSMPEGITGRQCHRLARTPTELFALEDHILASSVLGHSLVHVDHTAASLALGTETYLGSAVDLQAFHINPFEFAHALADMNSQYITEHCPVLSITRVLDGEYLVRTKAGTVLAQYLVLAAGVNIDSVLMRRMTPLVPIQTYMLATEVLPGDIANELIPSNACAYDVGASGNYFRKFDGRLLFGGRDAVGNDPDSAFKALRAQMTEVFPQLHDTSITHFWAGQIDMSMSQMPCFEEHERVFSLQGYSGHGLNLAFAAGPMITDRITGRYPGRWEMFRAVPSWKLPRYSVLQNLVGRIGLALR